MQGGIDQIVNHFLFLGHGFLKRKTKQKSRKSVLRHGISELKGGCLTFLTDKQEKQNKTKKYFNLLTVPKEANAKALRPFQAQWF